MAHSTLAVLAHPEFPQIYADAIDEAIACVDRVLSRYKTPALESCQFVYHDDCGPAAGLSCRKAATITCLSDEQEYCLGHFEEVGRG